MKGPCCGVVSRYPVKPINEQPDVTFREDVLSLNEAALTIVKGVSPTANAKEDPR